MRKILRVGKDVKERRSRVRELMNLKLSALELDIKLQLIQELIPLGLKKREVGSKTTYLHVLTLYFDKFHVVGPQWNSPWNSTG